MKFELNTLSRSCLDEEIFSEIKRVDEIVGRKILTASDFDKHGKISSSAIRRRFGSWRNVLEKAGFGSKYSGKMVSEKMRGQQTKNLTDGQILNELKRIATKLKHDFVTQEDVNTESNIIAASTVAYRFGSWANGLEQAGLKKVPSWRKISEEKLLENILNVWTHYGRQPFYSEMGKAPSTISPGTYEGRFGSWRKALEAFVIKMNQENGDVKYTESESNIQQSNELTDSQYDEKITQTTEGRGVNLSLRYKVLSRDNFRCVRCGRSPATDIGIELHIDHKIPFSKGGKTILENLETKCRECNLGKSNRHVE